MDLKLKTLKSYLNNKKSYLLFFLLFFFSTLLAIDVKSYILIFLLFFLTCFFVFKKDIFESTFLTLLISLPFENTLREWSFYSPLNNPDGYSFVFGVTIKIIMSTTLLLLIILPKYRKLLNIKCSKNYLLLLIFFALASIGSIFFQKHLDFVFVGYVRLLISIWLFFIASIYFSQKNKNYIFKYYIVSLIIFSTFVGLCQFVKQKPIGKFIELTPMFSLEDGYSTTDGEKQYRVSGFISHPVYFGSFMSILIPIFFGIFLKTNIKNKSVLYLKYVYLILIALSVLVLLAALSRSTWINILIIISFFYFYIKKNKLVIFPNKISEKFKKIIFLFLIIALIPIISVLMIRIKSIPDLITNKDGSVSSRLTLAKKSFELMSVRPLTGVGLNNFTFETYKEVSSTFVAPPHNTFLIFLTELGIPATLIFIFFIFFSLSPKTNIFKEEPIIFGVWVALITFIISAQFHPLFNIDPTFDIFMFILGYFSICRQSKT